MIKKKSNNLSGKKFALLSVFDKTGIVEFAKALIDLGYSIISTGGTAKVLESNNIPVIPIQEITGNPESFDGRMKTISFEIESGILFDRTNPTHQKEAQKLKIKPIDIVVCNLYPFEQTISKPNISLDEAVENIDVGGPTMIRAAAKNFKNAVVVVDPKDYQEISNILKNGTISHDHRQTLSAKAFSHLSFYDSVIADFLSREVFPEIKTLPLRKTLTLRYGENPHQQAAVYMQPRAASPFLSLEKKWGRDLSYVNITDINAGIESVRLFREPCAVVIKHNCPCGIALGKTPSQALSRAIDADPESAFGGVVVLNKHLDFNAANVIAQFRDEQRGNIDIVAAPSIDTPALKLLKKVRKTMGIYTFGKIPMQRNNEYNFKWINGGFVIQTQDHFDEDYNAWQIVTKKKPTKKQLEQMKIAWKFIMRIKSNAVIIVDSKLPMTRGIGTGQTSRIRSAKIALEQAGKYCRGGILASDSFFPFDDSVKLAAERGIFCIVQQGGSINDQASIDAANRAGIPMIFTHRRAFWH